MGVNCWYPGCQSTIGTTDALGIRYCPTHPFDRMPEPDHALPGLCVFEGVIHERTWLVPSLHLRNGMARACLRHYRALVRGIEP